ncbi:hypothetical protein NCC78_26775 [Micromonospora phytophila]|uniref:hypothetical protein n=1 Tax=Micromonospora phytophila TaxID=709888 RepID=UPI00202F3BE1|nr:hypothetical protein [Micromonospora phytophila]MCM0678254.1 hypothetical protein [Micromonospora phytophila]
MRRVSLVLLAVVTAVLAVTPPAVAATPDAQIRIEHRTSEFYPYDPSFDGGGPEYPATVVRGTVRNCPTGIYFLSASLTQDGLPARWATTARGAGEIICDGGTEIVVMGFYRAEPVVLHPGRATVRFELHSATDGVTLTETTRTVRIPR